LQLGR